MSAGHSGTTLYLGRVHLHSTAAKKGGVSQPLSAHTSAGFTYILRQRRRAVLAGHSVPRLSIASRSDPLTSCSRGGEQFSQPFSIQALDCISFGSTYNLQQRRRAVLAGHSALRHYTSSRSDSLTSYRSKIGNC